MKTKKSIYRYFIIMLLCSPWIVSCSDNDNGPSLKVQIKTDAKLGSFLADGEGNTLYYFTPDTDGSSRCTTGDCAALWPAYYSGKTALTQDDVQEGLVAADFGTVTTGGVTFTTYKGWPLYYFSPKSDGKNENGQVQGESIPEWFVAKPDYTINIAYGQLIGKTGTHYKADYTEGDDFVHYFTDAKGRTLYTFAFDKKNINNWTPNPESDTHKDSLWPVFDDALASIPSGIDKSLFGTIILTVAEESTGKTKQLTYKGWPLYYYGNDTKRGETKGVDDPFPKVWPVAVADAVEAPE